MNSPPGQLDVTWGTHSVEVGLYPLRQHYAEEGPLWARAIRSATVLGVIVVGPLVLGEAFGVLAIWFPPLVMAGLFSISWLWELLAQWHRDNAHLVMHIRPQTIQLVHRLGPFPVVTEDLPLTGLRTLDLDALGTLRFVLQNGRVICEPLPALTPDSRLWLLDALNQARRQTADFWRQQLAHGVDQKAVEQLAEGVSRPR